MSGPVRTVRWSNAVTFVRLTGFNLRHLSTSPLFLLLVPAVMALVWLTSHASGLPTMGELFNEAVLCAAGVGAAMFAVTTFPALREVRHSRSMALPLSPGARLASLALASITLTTALMCAFLTVFVVTAPAPIAGTPQPAAFVGVVVLGWAGPMGAVASVAWTRSYAPLIALTLLLPLYLSSSLLALGTRTDVLVSRMGSLLSMAFQPLPVSYPDTATTALFYLAHTVSMVLCAGLLTLAARRDTRFLRPVGLAVTAVVLVGMAALHVHAQREYSYDALSANARPRTPSTGSCQGLDGMTYCPLPGYESWVVFWHADLEPVLRTLPEDVHRPTVWQANPTLRADVLIHPPDDGIVLTEYWRPDEETHRARLRSDLVSHVLGMGRTDDMGYVGTGQARTVVGAWLVSVEGEGVEAAEWFLTDFSPGRDDLRLTHALLALPEERVAAVVHEHWDVLTSSATDLATLAELLGLSLTGPEAIPEPDWDRSTLDPEFIDGQNTPPAGT
ncbi:hypothetical protein ACWGKS_17415 [Nocardiopsis sp. NPDC055879]